MENPTIAINELLGLGDWNEPLRRADEREAARRRQIDRATRMLGELHGNANRTYDDLLARLRTLEAKGTLSLTTKRGLIKAGQKVRDEALRTANDHVKTTFGETIYNEARRALFLD